MWGRYLDIKIYLLQLLADFFILSRKCITSKKISSWTVSSKCFFSLFPLFCHILFLPEDLLFVTTLVTLCEFALVNILESTFFHVTSINFLVHTVLFLLLLYNIYSYGRTHHSYFMLPLIDVNITIYIIVFLIFYWITHSFYHTWLINCPKLFQSSADQYFYLISLQGFQLCSCIIQVGWTLCGS